MNKSYFTEPFEFYLNEPEWQSWQDLGFPTWSWGDTEPASLHEFFRETFPSMATARRQVIIPAESAEQFRMWQIMRNYRTDLFDFEWQQYLEHLDWLADQAEHILLETPPPVAESNDADPVLVAPIQLRVCCDAVSSSGDDKLD